MSAEQKRIQMHIVADARLAAAAGGAARYLAGAAGLQDDAVSQLQAATVAACLQAFQHLTAEHPRLEVTLTRFADRIELALAQEGNTAPAAGLAAKAGALSGVDRVQYETHGGVAVTRLTKYLRPAAPAA